MGTYGGKRHIRWWATPVIKALEMNCCAVTYTERSCDVQIPVSARAERQTRFLLDSSGTLMDLDILKAKRPSTDNKMYAWERALSKVLCRSTARIKETEQKKADKSDEGVGRGCMRGPVRRNKKDTLTDEAGQLSLPSLSWMTDVVPNSTLGEIP